MLETLPERGGSVTGLAFTPDSHGLICGRSYKMVEYWDISPLVGEPSSHPDSQGVSKRDTLNGNGVCTMKFTASEVHIHIEQVTLDVSNFRCRAIFRAFPSHTTVNGP